MASECFDYERFVRLQGSELIEYADRLLHSRDAMISTEIIHRILVELSTYDYEHAIFALELGFTRNPREFVPRVPPFLTHPHQSVRLWADKILARTDSAYITKELIAATELALQDCPERVHFTATLEGLRHRLRVL